MMKRPLLPSLILMALILAFGPGCAKNVTPAQGVNAGTIDGGGGAGYRGRPIEDWARDVRELPEFKEHVEPILKHVGRLSSDYERVFRHIANDRLWIFVDEPIGRLSAARQGLPLDNFDQWAKQDAHEIWMSNAYQGSEAVRAKILIHELLVGLKIMRFLSYNEYCYQWTSDRASCPADGNAVLIKSYKLTDEDHEDVRKMTDWLTANAAKMTAADFGQQMHTLQFQSPFFSWKQTLFSKNSRVMNSTVNALAQKGTRRLYTNYGQTYEATATCDLTFTMDNANRLNVSVKVAEIGSGRALQTFDLSVKYDPRIDIRQMEDGLGETGRYSVLFDEGRPMTKLGDRNRDMSLAFDDERLMEVYLGEGRLVEIKDGATSVKSNDDGPRGLSCGAYPINLPSEYTRWLSMRQADREFLERARFGGQLVRDLMRKYQSTMSENP